MSRRISVLVAVAALAVSSFAHAADSKKEKTQQETQSQTAKLEAEAQQDVPAAAPATLEKTFTASAEGASIETEDGVSAMVGPIDVVISRIGADGKPVMACVDTLEAARRFFAAPVETVMPKQKKEQ